MHAVLWLCEPCHAFGCLVTTAFPTFTLQHLCTPSCMAPLVMYHNGILAGPGPCPARYAALPPSDPHLSCARSSRMFRPLTSSKARLSDGMLADDARSPAVLNRDVRRCCLSTQDRAMARPAASSMLCGVGCEPVWAWTPGVFAWHRGLARQRVTIRLTGCARCEASSVPGNTPSGPAEQHSSARPPCCAQQLDHTHVSGQVVFGALINQQRSSAALAQRSSSHASLLLRLL